jgi:hypothetical protein
VALETVNGNGHAETVNGNGHAKDRPAKEEGEASDDGGDTLGKLWPTISDKNKSFDG